MAYGNRYHLGGNVNASVNVTANARASAYANPTFTSTLPPSSGARDAPPPRQPSYEVGPYATLTQHQRPTQVHIQLQQQQQQQQQLQVRSSGVRIVPPTYQHQQQQRGRRVSSASVNPTMGSSAMTLSARVYPTLGQTVGGGGGATTSCQQQKPQQPSATIRPPSGLDQSWTGLVSVEVGGTGGVGEGGVLPALPATATMGNSMPVPGLLKLG